MVFGLRGERGCNMFLPLWFISTVLLFVMMGVLMLVICIVPENVSSVPNAKLYILATVMVVEVTVAVLTLQFMVSVRVTALSMLLTEDVLVVAGDPVSFERLSHRPLLGVDEITRLQMAIEHLYWGISEELQHQGIIPNISYGAGATDGTMNTNRWHKPSSVGPGGDDYDEPSCEYYSLNKYLQDQKYRGTFSIGSFFKRKTEKGAWDFGVLNRLFGKTDSFLSGSCQIPTYADAPSLCSSSVDDMGGGFGGNALLSRRTSARESSGAATTTTSDWLSPSDDERGKKNEYNTSGMGIQMDGNGQSTLELTPLSPDGRLVCDPLGDNTNNQFEMLAKSLRLEGAIIIQILKSLRVGRSLSSVTLPVHILESRSLLELLSDMFVSWDLLLPLAVKRKDEMHPVDRMRVMLCWFLAAYNWRPKGISKKPYNPILGEVFLCKCPAPIPSDIQLSEYASDALLLSEDDDPSLQLRKTSLGCMRFLAEQVCHRPPVSVFYAEVPGLIIAEGVFIPQSKLVSINCAASLACSSVVVRFPQNGWSYSFSLPNVYATGVVMGTPRLELGGTVQLKDSHSSTCATVKFLRKGFFGGKFDEVVATISTEDGLSTAEEYAGVWHGAVYPRPPTTVTTPTTTRTARTTDVMEREEVHEEAAPARVSLFDAEAFQRLRGMRCNRPHAYPVDGGHPKQSRVVWKDVTAAIRSGDVETAARSKFAVEEAQRAERRQMAEEERQHQPQFFTFLGDGNLGLGNERELGKQENWKFTAREMLFR